MFSRIRTRVAAVAATSALALGASALGAGAAHAVTNESAVDDNKVSVTFSLEQGEALTSCLAALVPTAIAPQFLGLITGPLDLDTARELFTRDDVTTLRTGGLIPSPLAVLAPIVTPSVTLSADDVPSNVYTLATYCVGDEAPGINPAVVVGDPVEAVMGSVEAGSSGENLAAASASLPTLLGLLAGGGVS